MTASQNRLIYVVAILFFSSILFFPTEIFAKDGDLDTTFGTGGRVVLDLGFPNEKFVDVVEHDGKYYALGFYSETTYYEGVIIVARFTKSGTLDTTFNSTGYITFSYEGYSLDPKGINILSDGTIVLYGKAYCSVSGWDIFSVSYDASGAFINSKFTSLGDRYDFEEFTCALPVESSSDLYLVGSIGKDIILARVNKQSEFVTSFGNDADSNGTPDGYYLISGLDLLPRDCAYDPSKTKINITGGYSDWLAARITLTGEIDAAFGTAGLATFDLNAEYDYSETAQSIFFGTDDALYIGGSRESDYALAKFSSEGAADLTFAGNTTGYIAYDLGLSVYLTHEETQLDLNQYFISLGNHVDEVTGEIYVTRSLNNGLLDTANFGTSGYVKISFQTNGTDYGYANLIDAENHIVIAGTSQFDFALYRLVNDSTPSAPEDETPETPSETTEDDSVTTTDETPTSNTNPSGDPESANSNTDETTTNTSGFTDSTSSEGEVIGNNASTVTGWNGGVFGGSCSLNTQASSGNPVTGLIFGLIGMGLFIGIGQWLKKFPNDNS